MSIEASRHVWATSKQSGSALIVLLAIADYADKTGLAWPTVKTLAAKARMSIRNVQYHLNRLKEAGEINVLNGDNFWSANRYQIVGLHPGGAEAFTGDMQPPAPGGRNALHPGGAEAFTHKNPSDINGQTQPSLKPSPSTPARDAVVVDFNSTSPEDFSESKIQIPEVRSIPTGDEGEMDIMESPDSQPSPYGPSPVPSPSPHRHRWGEFFTYSSNQELENMEKQHGAAVVDAWIAQARTMKLDNPPGYVIVALRKGTPPPVQEKPADDWRSEGLKYISGPYASIIHH